MDVAEIHEQLRKYKEKGLRLFTTSSFQSHSLVLLHILSRFDKSIPVYFLDTGFHFPETLSFRDEVAASFGLNIINLRSDVPKSAQRNEAGQFLYASDPDYCCFINKVKLMEAALVNNDVWINGVRADQNQNRAQMQVEQRGQMGILRFHPILDWNSKRIYAYIREHALPQHPLEKLGYLSIGCEPCTRKFDPEAGSDRNGRLFGMNKTECGLHLESK